MSTVVELLTELGGVATRPQLVTAVGRVALEQSVVAGEVVVPARGRYVLAGVDTALAVAHEMSAPLSHRSAALHRGWAVKTVPDRPEVLVSRNRKLSRSQAGRLLVHRGTLHPGDVVDGVTSSERTLLDCLRALPGDEALAVADSALRAGFSPARLRAVARDARGPGSARARHVASLAEARAANPFESVLRWIGHDVAGLDLRPQQAIRDPRWLGRPDLVDHELKIVAEADSFEWHGGREALARDARRYNALVVHGWLVLRFSYDDVMRNPTLVRETLVAAVARRTNVGCSGCRAA